MGTSIERAVRREPEDALLWLALAEAAADLSRTAEMARAEPSAFPPVTPPATPPAEAYQRALDLAADSPVVLLRYGMYCLAQAGDFAREEELRGQNPAQPLPLRSPEEKASLRQAEGLFARCAQLMPGNAGPDYFLAWARLAERRDDEALGLLRGALAKSTWDLGDRAAAEAILRLVDKAGMPAGTRALYARCAGCDNRMPIHARLRSLARVLVGLGDGFRAAGRHGDAILCYESGVHIGHLVRDQAYDMIDGLVGVAVSAISGGSLLPAREAQQINATSKSQEQRVERTTQAKIAAFADYLRHHGRADLASFYERDMQEALRWKQDARAATRDTLPRTMRLVSGGGVLNAGAVWLMAAAFAVFALWVGLISLALRYWREPRTPLRFSQLQWIVLLLVAVVPAQVAALAWGVSGFDRPAERWPSSLGTMWVALALGLLLWLVGAVHLSLRARARLSPGEQRGSGRTCLAGLRALLAPTLAALVLLCVVSFWPLRAGAQRVEQRDRELIVQGEARYYGLGSGHPGPVGPPPGR